LHDDGESAALLPLLEPLPHVLHARHALGEMLSTVAARQNL